jgi:hypothetical protein
VHDWVLVVRSDYIDAFPSLVYKGKMADRRWFEDESDEEEYLMETPEIIKSESAPPISDSHVQILNEYIDGKSAPWEFVISNIDF